MRRRRRGVWAPGIGPGARCQTKKTGEVSRMGMVNGVECSWSYYLTYTREDGSEGGLASGGFAGLPECVADAAHYAQYYMALGYRVRISDVSAQCSACFGTGTVAGKRKRIGCKSCKGVGAVLVDGAAARVREVEDMESLQVEARLRAARKAMPRVA
jgi:hypothetical protein